MNRFRNLVEDFIHLCHFSVMIFQDFHLFVNMLDLKAILIPEPIESHCQDCGLNLVFHCFSSQLLKFSCNFTFKGCVVLLFSGFFAAAPVIFISRTWIITLAIIIGIDSTLRQNFISKSLNIVACRIIGSA